MAKFPRFDILKSLVGLTSAITPNCFPTTRPPATGKQMNEFLLVSLNNIEDTADTYQLTRGKISIFVRDVNTDNGNVENTFRLEQLQEAVTGLFPIRTDLYLATKPLLLAGGSDGAGFHTLIIQFNIRIHKEFDIHPTEKITL